MLLVLPALAEKKIIYPPEFRPNMPFSPGVLVDGTLYVAGQTGTDLKTNKLPDNFPDEVRNTLDRIGIILKAAGMDFSDAVNVIVYLTDISLFGQMNEVYTQYFKTNRPARATVQVAGLVGGAKIEISVTAKK
jgi:2-iminobutanoate/2-iminopropanoate deaminase